MVSYPLITLKERIRQSNYCLLSHNYQRTN